MNEARELKHEDLEVEETEHNYERKGLHHRLPPLGPHPGPADRCGWCWELDALYDIGRTDGASELHEELAEANMELAQLHLERAENKNEEATDVRREAENIAPTLLDIRDNDDAHEEPPILEIDDSYRRSASRLHALLDQAAELLDDGQATREALFRIEALERAASALADIRNLHVLATDGREPA